MRRHLIYHVCPLTANDGWRRNLEQLGRRAAVFDTATVAIALSEELCHPLDYVCERVDEALLHRIGSRDEVKFLTLDNDPRLREVASFQQLLEIAFLRSELDDTIFYAHTKGNSTKDGERGAIRWRNAMYAALLDREHSLTDHDAVGACVITWDPRDRRRGACRRCPFPSGLQVPHRWMFAGTFFWFSPRLFGLDWRAAIRQDRYGAEGWLGHLIPRERALSVYQPRPEWAAWNPYDPEVYGGQYDD